jgi:hypothetical protein
LRTTGIPLALALRDAYTRLSCSGDGASDGGALPNSCMGIRVATAAPRRSLSSTNSTA